VLAEKLESVNVNDGVVVAVETVVVKSGERFPAENVVTVPLPADYLPGAVATPKRRRGGVRSAGEVRDRQIPRHCGRLDDACPERPNRLTVADFDVRHRRHERLVGVLDRHLGLSQRDSDRQERGKNQAGSFHKGRKVRN